MPAAAEAAAEAEEAAEAAAAEAAEAEAEAEAAAEAEAEESARTGSYAGRSRRIDPTRSRRSSNHGGRTPRPCRTASWIPFQASDMTTSSFRPSRSTSAIAGTPPKPSRRGLGKCGLGVPLRSNSRTSPFSDDPATCVVTAMSGCPSPSTSPITGAELPCHLLDHVRGQPGKTVPFALPDVQRAVRLDDDLRNAVAVEIA